MGRGGGGASEWDVAREVRTTGRGEGRRDRPPGRIAPGACGAVAARRLQQPPLWDQAEGVAVTMADHWLEPRLFEARSRSL